MNKKVILNILVSFITAISYSQQKFCADSSIRIKYKSGNPNYFLGGAFYPDTNGYSMLLGAYNNATSTENGMIIAKNNWGDSIYWSKKYTSITNVILSAHNIIKNSNDVLLVTGERKYLGSTDFMLCRIDTNGNILWSRFFPLKTGHINYIGLVNKNSRIVFPTNNAIYISLPLDNLQTIFKLDLNGNLIWSKGLYTLPLFSSSPVYGIFEKNGVIYFTMNKIRQAPNTSIIYSGTIITGLNESDGSINESVLLSIIPDNLAKGLHSINLNYNNDGTVLLTGFVCLSLPGAGIEANPNTMFNLQLNNAFNLIRGNYYKTDITSGLALRFDINSLKQSIFLYNKEFNPIKYFLVFDSTQILLKSRKFTIAGNANGGEDITIDNKKNIHIYYNYTQNNQSTLEYVRLSDIAMSNDLSCFGIDTASIFEQFPISVTIEPFSWDIINDDVLNCIPVNINTEVFTITKEVICKQVSYCDSIKIQGNATVCLPGPNVRYTTWLNPQCLKSRSWQVDTSFATIANSEADTAIILQFKKTGSFYLKTLVNNCVVADSLLITVTAPQTSLQLSKQDTLLCPGSSISLTVSPGFRTCRWQDGSSLFAFTVTTPGLYTVTATDSCGNIFADSVRILAADTGFAVQPRYSICPFDSAAVLLPPDAFNISWQPSSSGLLAGNRLLLFPPQTTAYTIRLQRPPGCILQKNTTVAKEDCPEWIKFPSGFTPNNDGLNDVFRPAVSGHPAAYELKIYERNGQLIFATKNPFAGWNGLFKGAAQNSGVFVFICQYRFPGKPETTNKGTFMLVR